MTRKYPSADVKILYGLAAARCAFPDCREELVERAQEVTEEIGCQYICTLNSDMVPRNEFSSDFDFDSHVRLILTDKKPADSLLGFHFEQPSK
jgi:uncharacterized protein YydD (DUF2326 family)